MIWKRPASLEGLNQHSRNTLVAHLGIVYTRIGDDELEGVMPVDDRTRQPFGLLHGGASAVLAESLGSVAGYLCTEGGQRVVGLEINANHLRGVTEGSVRGVCRPLHVGRTHQVWDIRIHDDQQRLTCIARLTTAVLEPR
ncbi:hotdog fold thioesterase [Sodalis ligni]|uniref:1,4-dihydroxy-2-naphthoyl-CoA hydrolase n=1 Tax=Sodalis ligni TaxID=2697027 RepID=A0A4R1N642_9GAMM|nr:hotdog fold thioesterase [Sodalis ligni]QWA13627.1 hotdog fold thioesterase [Sodalis ligni]TCL02675.1 1,4-dihydroxy-2-naphthoyl-CoA hydrolase [Sodalis ligni]